MQIKLSKLGPGLLFAGAAIGVSHLVQSTRAGADFGWGLVWALLLINLFLHKLAKTLLLYETLTGDEIRDLILHNKSIERNDDKDSAEEDKSSALGSMGLKPKIVH